VPAGGAAFFFLFLCPRETVLGRPSVALALCYRALSRKGSSVPPPTYHPLRVFRVVASFPFLLFSHERVSLKEILEMSGLLLVF